MPNEYETPAQALARLRTTTLTPELMDFIVGYIKHGNYYVAACKAAGISYPCFRRWMEVGERSEDPTSIYYQFYRSVRAADAYAEIYAVGEWKKHFKRDYRAARDFLARRHPQRWAEQQRITLAVDSEIQRMLEVLQGKLSPEMYAEVITALAETRTEGAELLEGGIDDLLEAMPADTVEAPEGHIIDMESEP